MGKVSRFQLDYKVCSGSVLSENTASTKHKNKWNIHTYTVYKCSYSEKEKQQWTCVVVHMKIYIMISKWYMIGRQVN